MNYVQRGIRTLRSNIAIPIGLLALILFTNLPVLWALTFPSLTPDWLFTDYTLAANHLLTLLVLSIVVATLASIALSRPRQSLWKTLVWAYPTLLVQGVIVYIIQMSAVGRLWRPEIVPLITNGGWIYWRFLYSLPFLAMAWFVMAWVGEGGSILNCLKRMPGRMFMMPPNCRKRFSAYAVAGLSLYTLHPLVGQLALTLIPGTAGWLIAGLVSWLALLALTSLWLAGLLLYQQLTAWQTVPNTKQGRRKLDLYMSLLLLMVVFNPFRPAQEIDIQEVAVKEALTRSGYHQAHISLGEEHINTSFLARFQDINQEILTGADTQGDGTITISNLKWLAPNMVAIQSTIVSSEGEAQGYRNIFFHSSGKWRHIHSQSLWE